MGTTKQTRDLHHYTGYSPGWTRKRETTAAGDHTALHIASAKEAALAEGYTPVGTGSPPSGADIIYLPTSVSPGFERRCEKLYFSRWSRPSYKTP